MRPRPLIALVFALHGVASAGAGECTCAQARVTCGWCEACSTGFVATFPVRSRELFEVIHPHGHEVYADKTFCPRCQEAIRSDGWCPECRAGYLHQQAYFSRLTYMLAHGEAVDTQRLTCATCRNRTHRYGWCEACNIGWVGNIRFKSRADYAEATRQMDIFFTAVEVAEQCEGCATAMIMDGRCSVHRIRYTDGRPAKPPDSSPAATVPEPQRQK